MGAPGLALEIWERSTPRLQCVRLLRDLRLRERPHEQHAAAAGHDVLAAVQFITDGRALHRRAHARVPQGFAVAGVKREQVAIAVPGDRQPGIRGHHAGRGTDSQLMAPANLASLVIDGLYYTLAPYVVIRARPSVHAIRGLGEINAPARMRVHD